MSNTTLSHVHLVCLANMAPKYWAEEDEVAQRPVPLRQDGTGPRFVFSPLRRIGGMYIGEDQLFIETWQRIGRDLDRPGAEAAPWTFHSCAWECTVSHVCSFVRLARCLQDHEVPDWEPEDLVASFATGQSGEATAAKHKAFRQANAM